MTTQHKAWDFLLNRTTVLVEYPANNIQGIHFRILGGDGKLWDINKCTAYAGIIKGKI